MNTLLAQDPLAAGNLTNIDFDSLVVTEPLVIEFFGLPGAGKTTVTNAVVAALKDEGFSVFDNSDRKRLLARTPRRTKALLAVEAILGLLGNISSIVALGLSLRPVALWRWYRLAKLPLSEVLLRHSTRNLSGDVLILDQCTVQDIWSIATAADAWNHHAVTQIVRRVLRVNRRMRRAFVYVHVDIPTAATRISERLEGWSPFDGKPRHQILPEIERDVPFTEQLLEQVRNMDYPLLEIDGHASINEKSEQIRQWIRHLTATC